MLLHIYVINYIMIRPSPPLVSKEPRPQGGALKNFKTILIVSRGDHLDDI
jgi:hypothetical protein